MAKYIFQGIVGRSYRGARYTSELLNTSTKEIVYANTEPWNVVYKSRAIDFFWNKKPREICCSIEKSFTMSVIPPMTLIQNLTLIAINKNGFVIEDTDKNRIYVSKISYQEFLNKTNDFITLRNKILLLAGQSVHLSIGGPKQSIQFNQIFTEL